MVVALKCGEVVVVVVALRQCDILKGVRNVIALITRHLEHDDRKR